MKRIFLLFALSIAMVVSCNGNPTDSELDSSEHQTTSEEVGTSIEESSELTTTSESPGDGVTYYLNNGGSELWGTDNPDFYIYTFTLEGLIQTMGEWPGTKMSPVSGDVFSANVNGDHDRIMFLRMDPSYNPMTFDPLVDEIDDFTWNKTDDLTKPIGLNLFTINAWHGGDENNSQGVWSTYTA